MRAQQIAQQRRAAIVFPAVLDGGEQLIEAAERLLDGGRLRACSFGLPSPAAGLTAAETGCSRSGASVKLASWFGFRRSSTAGVASAGPQLAHVMTATTERLVAGRPTGHVWAHGTLSVARMTWRRCRILLPSNPGFAASAARPAALATNGATERISRPSCLHRSAALPPADAAGRVGATPDA